VRERTTHHPKWLVVDAVARVMPVAAKDRVLMRHTNALEQLIAGSLCKRDDWLQSTHHLEEELLGEATFSLRSADDPLGSSSRKSPMYWQGPAIIFTSLKKGFFAAGSEIGLAFAVLLCWSLSYRG